MEQTEKLTDVNQVIEYLAQQFPQCFTATGETKPLKIGLFQELAERLAEDPKVSKTQLRVAIRRYTNSWRYLKSIKAGVERVDLDGNPCGVLEEEHVEHAAKALEESQAKAKAMRAEKAAEARKNSKRNARAQMPKGRKPAKSADKPARKPREVEQEGTPVQSLAELKPQQKVKVKLGKSAVSGQVLEIVKQEVNVQLDSGLTVKVRLEHIQV
ncbi:RNA chaperone ProQ [Paraferrimonas sedimenticola]|uniref:RNA chaperone ProQ n=1 Tax=Paraferrimonas sedimenticola TaxID=375674 RepID=A0AA37S0E7_9GAMM|nr:RNA chaperone ProQ [Paraferrimonas sedimenticola]GLP98072.1 RNA chaperone ProQ [Paraferrimonas sedimenticola]